MKNIINTKTKLQNYIEYIKTPGQRQTEKSFKKQNEPDELKKTQILNVHYIHNTTKTQKTSSSYS